MDIAKMAANARKAEYTKEALMSHMEEVNYHEDGSNEDCERCANILKSAKEVAYSTPDWMMKMMTIFMWITHPFLMRRFGSVQNILDNKEKE